MKRNSLTTAIVAGIAGIAGFAGLANAVDLNPDGLGQTLLYPYYEVSPTAFEAVDTVYYTDPGNLDNLVDFKVHVGPPTPTPTIHDGMRVLYGIDTGRPGGDMTVYADYEIRDGKVHVLGMRTEKAPG